MAAKVTVRIVGMYNFASKLSVEEAEEFFMVARPTEKGFLEVKYRGDTVRHFFRNDAYFRNPQHGLELLHHFTEKCLINDIP